MDLSSQSINFKIRHIYMFIISIAIIVLCRLIYLQIIQQHILFVQSQKNYMRLEKIHSLRGNILDINGEMLATNRPSTNLYWHGTGNHTLTNQQHETLKKITAITGKEIYEDTDLWASLIHTERYSKDILLVHDLSFEQLSQLEEQFPAIDNIKIKTTFKRHYPHHKTACHIIGYLGNMDAQALGKMGLEKICEEDLKGLEGSRLKKINSFGTSLAEIEMSKGLAGKNINTTIDFTLQTIADSIFPDNRSGVIILMDPEDGSIRALVSRPDFDPEFFLHRFTQEEWLTLQDKQPFLNRAFNACYPPGSIFKIITMCTALECNIISPDTLWHCPGYYILGNHKYMCNLRSGHGTLTACESLARSCNILFFDVGRRVNIDLIADYARRFGLGKKTGVIFAEKEGLIPDRAWKMKNKRERWWPGDTLSVAIGQSYLSVTPIQIACMIGSIFTHTIVKPRILREEPIEKHPLDIKADTLSFIKQAMQEVVIRGTGRRIGRLRGFDIFAKTSTAQVGTLAKEKLGDKYLPHAWFASYFKFQDQKPLVLIVLVEHGGSSRVPTQLARNFLLSYRNYIEHNQNVLKTPQEINNENIWDEEEIPSFFFSQKIEEKPLNIM